MRRRAQRLVFSPSDVNRFYESPFASWMDRHHLDCAPSGARDLPDAETELVARLGIAHEQRYLQQLMAAGNDVWQAPAQQRFDQLHEATLTALRAGRGVLYQAALCHGTFEGHADFLLRVDKPSKLGAFSYEIADTKLARQPRPYFLLQLCAYAKMLEQLQGVRPEHVYVINGDGEKQEFRTDDYFYYFESIERAFLDAQSAFDPKQRPLPEARANHGHWDSLAEEILEQLDHPSRVAAISSGQIRRLAEVGIHTLAQLGSSTLERVPRMDDAVLERLRGQARLQHQSTLQKRILYEAIVPGGEREREGLALLPPESPNDVYFDMEGYPLIEGGLEYLFGATHLVGGREQYQDFWGLDRAGEKLAFESFIDWIYARFLADGSMHVFHYASYEVAALRRLMGQHATREREVDTLLRAEVFVDLYRVVKQSVRIGVPSYSLKKIEQLYRPSRSTEVATAAQSITEYARWLDEPDGSNPAESAILRGIRDYNRDDCESTRGLRVWLAEVQRSCRIAYVLPTPHEKGAEPAVDAVRDARAALARELLDECAIDPDVERRRVPALLAHLLEFHRRESKPVWWTVFDRQARSHAELADDVDCLGACTRTATPATPIKKSLLYEYSFPAEQDTKLGEGSKCFIAEDLTRTTIETIDLEAGLVQIRRGPDQDEPPALMSLIPDEDVKADTLEQSIEGVVRRWRASGELPPALDTLLRRAHPRVRGIEPGSDLLAGARASVDTVTDLLQRLDRTALSIQGPPGAGKTRVASSAILKLAQRGYRIGISSNSHKVIEKLIDEVLKRAESGAAELRVTKIGGDYQDERVDRAGGMKDVSFDEADAPQIVGGTAFAFSHPSAVGRFDYLFVDEAGQVSLANLVAVSPSAKNLVLLGDQMQLGQPTRASHPGESGQSVLEYLLQRQHTVPNQLGVFLDRTWRLHPNLCRFISGAIYDNKLEAEACTSERTVRVGRKAGRIDVEAGIVFVPVEHEGNTQCSDEEVEAVVALVEELRGRQITGSDGARSRKLQASDVLVVAPYNRQVRALHESLADHKIGSVDKFQGQEAAVVIVSMCASSGEGLPRGLDFLLSPRRLNVALSRAQSLAIVVGSPRLARMHASSVAQMRLLNLYCRIIQEGTVRAGP